MKNMKKMEYSSDDQFSTTKYVIKINYTIKGSVSVMDIIGALFGQTEGLLNDLELRELQKTGRIGRIQVQNNTEDGNSVGQILIPSSLDRVETAILAATIESVDRVGPCTAQMRLSEISDIREDKRKKIMDRATELLQKWDIETPEAEEMGESILDNLRTGEVIEFGPDKLPAGQDIDKSQQVIIVEGIADVKTMMRAGFRNAIGTNGTSVPKTIVELSKKKSCIAFVDGDRGGQMILNELLQVADIDFIAVAPKGLMVEELTRKEIIKHLQGKKTLQEWKADNSENRTRTTKSKWSTDRKSGSPRNSRKVHKNLRSDKKPRSRRKSNSNNYRQGQKSQNRSNSYKKSEPKRAPRKPKNVDPKIVEHIKGILASNEAIGLDANKTQTFKVGNTKVFNTLDTTDTTNTLVLDGVVTQRLLDKAAEKNINEIYAVNRAKKLKFPKGKRIEINLFKDYLEAV